MVRHESEQKPYPVYNEQGLRVFKQILVGPRDGFDGYLREFTLEPGANSPYHRHDWYHVAYVIDGKGVARIDGVEHPIRPGSAVHVPGGVVHGFFNSDEGGMRFLCLVPPEGDAYTEAEMVDVSPEGAAYRRVHVYRLLR